tara:strand:+ start:519 stop:782 length:264 start_codon:yes stop_codon:yes gene_type:complete
MPEVDGKKYAYTAAGKAAAKKAAQAGKAAGRAGGYAAGKGVGASGVARSAMRKAAAQGPMYRQGADRKTLKKASNRDAVTKRTMQGY